MFSLVVLFVFIVPVIKHYHRFKLVCKHVMQLSVVCPSEGGDGGRGREGDWKSGISTMIDKKNFGPIGGRKIDLRHFVF